MVIGVAVGELIVGVGVACLMWRIQRSGEVRLASGLLRRTEAPRLFLAMLIMGWGLAGLAFIAAIAALILPAPLPWT